MSEAGYRLVEALMEYCPPGRTGPQFPVIEGEAEEVVEAMFVADHTLAQDILDGAALRELREALPPEWHVNLDRWERDGRVTYELHVNHMHTGYGATIAEAADKCREAMVPREVPRENRSK